MDGKIAELHRPVLLSKCVELVQPALLHPGAIFVDCTLGLGGHTEAVLTACPHAVAYGIDRDPQALKLAARRLSKFADRFHPLLGEYDQIVELLSSQGVGEHEVDAVLFDLGVSSLQLDEVERGFSYAVDAPLDMRMNQSQGETAAGFLNRAGPEEIAWVLRTYGEERFAGRIATKIVSSRQQKKLERTSQLVEIVRESIPAAARRKGGNPAKRTFQALRIHVNDELGILRRALPAALGCLASGGRLVVEAYHSLEDRLVKNAFREATVVHTLVGLPTTSTEKAKARQLTRGAIQADAAEIEKNPRSTSVRLRAIEIISPLGPEKIRQITAAISFSPTKSTRQRAIKATSKPTNLSQSTELSHLSLRGAKKLHSRPTVSYHSGKRRDK